MKKVPDSTMALNAMRRASKNAIKRAAMLDLEMPFWEDGKVIYVKARELLKENTSSDFHQTLYPPK